MTTIAYRDGILAADSQITDSDGWSFAGSVSKLHRLKDGTLIGITGALEAASVFIDWMNSDRSAPRPSVGDRSRIIHLTEEGIAIYEGIGSFRTSGDFMAWGSGFPIALGAMEMGATAHEAVEAAAKYDPHTGGTIILMRLDQSASYANHASSITDQELRSRSTRLVPRMGV